MAYEYLERRDRLMDFFQTLDARYYGKCHPQPGSSSCYGEYGKNYYIFITNFIWRNLDEIADRVGVTSDEYTEEQLDAAWGLVDRNFLKGGFVDE
jgi:hypothetical protein